MAMMTPPYFLTSPTAIFKLLFASLLNCCSVLCGHYILQVCHEHPDSREPHQTRAACILLQHLIAPLSSSCSSRFLPSHFVPLNCAGFWPLTASRFVHGRHFPGLYTYLDLLYPLPAPPSDPLLETPRFHWLDDDWWQSRTCLGLQKKASENRSKIGQGTWRRAIETHFKHLEN